MIVNILAVAGGAFVGGCCRSALADLLNRKTWRIPWGTFAANMLGSLLLGICLGWAASSAATLTSPLKALIVTGFCGGFTTFSTFTGEVFGMISHDSTPARSFLYWVGSVVVGLALVALGFVLGRAL